MKYFTLLFVVVALSCCEAGLLKTIGKGTEQLGSAINQGAIKVEDSLHSLFNAKKGQEKQPVQPVLPESKPAAVENVDLTEIGVENRPDLAGAPEIEIVYGKSAVSTPQKFNRNSAVITDDDDDVNKEAEKDCGKVENVNEPGCREIIKGAIRCGAGEIFINGGCRVRD